MVKAEKETLSEDALLQQNIIQKLNEYGDSILDSKTDRKKKKKSASSVNSDITTNSKSVTSNTQSQSTGTKRKRKKKKKRQIEEEEAKKDKTDSENKIVGKERHIEKIKRDLGLVDFKTKQDEKKKKEKEVKTTKAGRKVVEPEIVVYKSHKSKRSKELKKAGVSQSTDDDNVFNLREARFEVQKFGIKGLLGEKKDEAMTALLIKLGAKPPKNKMVNYKEYQEISKQKVVDDQEKKEVERKMGYKMAKPKRGTKRTKDKNDIGHVDGQVGKWRSGVQYIDNSSIKKIKLSKTSRIKK